MSSWREIASAEAQADLDGLLDTVLGFAQQQLTHHGEFYPFAAAVGQDGHLEPIAALPDAADDRPASADVREVCSMTVSSAAAARAAASPSFASVPAGSAR